MNEIISEVFPQLGYTPKDITAQCYFCDVLDVKDLMFRVKTGFRYHKVWVCSTCNNKYEVKR